MCGNLRLLNFNNRRNTEKVFEGSVLVHHAAVTQQARDSLDVESLRSMQVLGYAEDIVSLYCDFGPFGQYVFAVDISNPAPANATDDGLHPRVRLCVPVRSPNKLFVRHNDKYMVMGSHSATGSHGHHEWLLQTFDLESAQPVNTAPLQLQGFCGSEPGSTVCFAVHDDHFYAVTNQTSFESEEIDWTSYYQVVKFRLDDPQPELPIKVVWRRQHLEGPINDAWTDLGFQIDQSTGELLIVECRKEWLNGGSKSTRTFYSQPVRRAEYKDAKDGERHPPTSDPLISTLDENSNSRYEDPKERIDRYVHREFPATNKGDAKEYIRAKTKWNGYSFNTQSFTDLVIDEYIPDGEWRPRQCIRLRVVSRQEVGVMVRDEDSLNPAAMRIRCRVKDRDGVELEDSERAFSPGNVYLWPPDNAPQELHEVLCPGGRAGDVSAILGDEGIIYMAGPPREPGSAERALVFMSFDPTFGFAGMKRLDGSFAVPKRDRKRRPDDISTEFELPLSELSDNSLSSPGLIDRTKKLKIKLSGSSIAASSSSVPVNEKPDPEPEAELTVPPQGDPLSQSLNLDPSELEPNELLFPSRSPKTSPEPLARRPELPSPPPPSDSTPRPPSANDNGKGKGKGKGQSQTPALTNWREKAEHININKGLWLR